MHKDVYNKESGDYDLNNCKALRVDRTKLDVDALALALALSGYSLEQLVLERVELDADGARTLAGAIEKHDHLRTLIINNNNISAAGTAAITEALHENSVLSRLFIGRADMRDGGASAVAELLRRNAAIKELELVQNDIGPPGMEDLSSALQENSALELIDLSVNPLFPASGEHLAGAITKNSGLKKLVLKFCGLHEGVRPMALAMEHNSALEHLDLWGNFVNDSQASSLGQALRDNHHLKMLTLWNNDITDDGVTMLATGLRLGAEKSQLEILQLGQNENITDGAIVALSKAVRHHSKITQIDFGQNKELSDQFVNPLGDALKCNHEHKDDPAVASECRENALRPMPMRLSVKDMLRSRGIDVEARRAENIRRAKAMADVQKKLSPEQAAEMKKIVEKYEKEKEELFKDDTFDINIAEVVKEQYGDDLPERLKNMTPGQKEEYEKAQKKSKKKTPQELLVDVMKDLYGDDLENMPAFLKDMKAPEGSTTPGNPKSPKSKETKEEKRARKEREKAEKKAKKEQKAKAKEAKAKGATKDEV